MRKVLAFILSLLVLAAPALAAVTPNSFVSPQTPNRGILQFTNASTPGTYGTLYTAGTNGSRCYSLWTTNSESTTTHLLTVQLVSSGTKYGGASITSNASAGFSAATPAQAVMAPATWPGLPVDQYGNPYVQLNNGDTLQATFTTTITSPQTLNFVASCSDF